MTITARYDGDGYFEDPGHDGTKTDEPVPSGGTFEVTQTRFDELVAQGIDLSKVSKTEAAKAADGGEAKA